MIRIEHRARANLSRKAMVYWAEERRHFLTKLLSYGAIVRFLPPCERVRVKFASTMEVGKRRTHLQMAIAAPLPLTHFLVVHSLGDVALCLDE
jgi:hypothetical protein